jgi:hypothetical protein
MSTASSPPTDRFLPVKPHCWNNASKLKRAQKLAAWVIKKVEENKARIAVISRCGSFLTVLYDQTGMTHSGIVFRHPHTQEWIVYNLYSDPDNNHKTSRLWQQSLVDFFYTQNSIKTDALVLIPKEDLQDKLLQRMADVPDEPLLPPDEHFNLVAPMTHCKSFNCTKWIMVNVYAAEKEKGRVEDVLAIMGREHEVPTLKAGPLTRFVMGFKPDVRLEENDPMDEIRTVTVGSLYQSPLFVKRFIYSGKKIIK